MLSRITFFIWQCGIIALASWYPMAVPPPITLLIVNQNYGVGYPCDFATNFTWIWIWNCGIKLKNEYHGLPKFREETIDANHHRIIVWWGPGLICWLRYGKHIGSWFVALFIWYVKCVKCYHGGRKIDFIPSISKIQTQMGTIVSSILGAILWA